MPVCVRARTQLVQTGELKAPVWSIGVGWGKELMIVSCISLWGKYQVEVFYRAARIFGKK